MTRKIIEVHDLSRWESPTVRWQSVNNEEEDSSISPTFETIIQFEISLKYVSQGPMVNKSASNQMMVWRRIGLLTKMSGAIWRHQMEIFPGHWPFVRGIHRWPVDSPHKGQWRRALVFYLISAWTNVWAYMGDLRPHRTHYDVTVMASLGHCEWTFFLLACGWRRNDCLAINFRAITPLHTPCGIYDTKFMKYASILSRNKPTGDFIFVRFKRVGLLCAFNWMSLGRWIKCLKDILFIFLPADLVHFPCEFVKLLCISSQHWFR